MPRGKYMRVSPRSKVTEFVPTVPRRWEYIDVMNKDVAERNLLGREGWECYAVIEGYANRVFFFKRALP